MTADHRGGKWARALLSSQQEDGTWPNWCFHSMAQPGRAPLTTEQALRRLHALGFTMADEPIRRIVATMTACLRGERKIDAYWEKGIDWAMFEPLMLAAWIRRFDPDNPEALALARRWARVTEAGFCTGTLDEAAWNAAYEAEFQRREKHPAPIGFTALYHLMLLPGQLRSEAECAMVRYVLENGVYYIYPRPLIRPPAAFAAKEASRWLEALELLMPYVAAREQLSFAAAWLWMNVRSDGQWDMGPKAKDGICFPLSDGWQQAAVRRADCTERICRFMSMLQ